MAFHDVRLPEDIERGAVGGPKFKTTVLQLQSGFEQRNIDWANTRGEWDIAYGLMSLQDQGLGTYIHRVRDFFYARQGRAHGFRFKDWSDYTIGNPEFPTVENQDIGLGDGATTVFQVFKRYDDTVNPYDRIIRKLVTGTGHVLRDGVELTTGFSINYNTGQITFTSPPAATGGTGPGGAQVIGFAGEFDVPVRFDEDHLQITTVMFQAGSVPGIPIVELRLA